MKTDSSHPLTIAVTTKTMVVAVLVGLVAWILSKLTVVALVLMVSLILMGTLSPGVEWLEKRRLGRGKSIGLVFTAMVLTVLGLLALAIPALVEQVGALAKAEPAIQEKLATILSRTPATRPLADSLNNVHIESLARQQAGVAFQYSTKALETVAYLMSALFLSLYMLIDRDRLRGALFAVVPRTHHIRLSRVLLNLETIVGGYLRGQIITSVLMGAFTFGLLLVCRVKNPLAIGVLAGVADVLPYVGVLLAVGPAVGAALAKGPLIAAIVFVALMMYEELESRFLVPRIYGTALQASVVRRALRASGRQHLDGNRRSALGPPCSCRREDARRRASGGAARRRHRRLAHSCERRARRARVRNAGERRPCRGRGGNRRRDRGATR